MSSCYDAGDTFTVEVDLDSMVAKCGCQLFEFMGILCRHILVIFQLKNIAQILNHFILQHLTKEANRGIKICVETNFNGQDHDSRILRRMHVQNRISKLVDIAEKSEEIYKFIISHLVKTNEKAIAKYINLHDDVVPSTTTNQVYEFSELTIRDPHVS